MNTDLVKQAEIIDDINALFTMDINSHEDVGGTHIKFGTVLVHNFVVGDQILFYDAIDSDNIITDFNEYNPTPGRIKFTITAKETNTFTVIGSYESGYDISSLKAKSVKVYNNALQEYVKPKLEDFPIAILDVEDTTLKKTANNHYLPTDTNFPFTIMDAIQKYGERNKPNTTVNNCRLFVSDLYKIVVDNLKLEIKDDFVERDEMIFNLDVSFKKCVLKK